MADGVPITAGVGTTIATDDISSVHYQYVKLVDGTADSAAKIAGDATNGLDVDVTRLPALVAGSANIGDVDVLTLPPLVAGTANIGDVDVLTLPPVTNAGTFVTQENGTALTALQLIDDSIFADEAAFTVASSKVTTVGLHSVVHGSAPDAAAVDTVVNPIANRDRVPFMIGGHPNVVSYGMSITTGATNAIIGPTVSTGSKLVVTSISFLLDNASTVFPSVVIGFGTSTTPAFATTPGTAKIIAGHPACPAGGGMTKGDGSGMIGVGADDEELRITTVGTAGGNGIYVLMTGYTVPS